MAKTNDDTNSTERLLNVIRGVQELSYGSDDRAKKKSSSAQKHSDKFALNFPRLFAGKHRATVGIDIGREEIRLAKITNASDGRPLLVDQKIVKFSKKIKRESREFNDLLKTAIDEFAGPGDECDIWAMMSAAEVNVHHLKIPNVPKNQRDNVIFWAAKKENSFDEKTMIFDYEIQGEINDQGVPKTSVMFYSAPRAGVEKVKSLFSAVGINLAGITIVPFAIQNIFRTNWIAAGEDVFASLYFGIDFSRIDIFSKNNLVMTRGIKTGISSMIEAIQESIVAAIPGRKVDSEREKQILQELCADPEKTITDEDGFSWTHSSVLEMISPAMERLTRQVERTLEYYATSVGFEKVEKIYISSAMEVFYNHLLQKIGEQLDIKRELFDPFQVENDATAANHLSLNERISMGTAIGLALSDRKHTPNAIFTYLEKNKEVMRTRINRIIFAAFGVSLAICLTVLAFQVIENRYLAGKKEKLEKQMALFQPLLSKDKVNALAGEIKAGNAISRQYSKKYKGMALIGELASLTPENIKLTNVLIVFPHEGGIPEQKQPEQKQEKDAKPDGESIMIEGVVMGNRTELDAFLAQYVLKLDNSAIFSGAALQKSSRSEFRKKEILQFTIKMKTG